MNLRDILPKKKLKSMEAKDVELFTDSYDIGSVQGYNDCIDDCLAALSKAGVAGVPDIKELMDCLGESNGGQYWQNYSNDIINAKRQAEAIRALILGKES